jgi:small subunit ribosomal protein S6
VEWAKSPDQLGGKSKKEVFVMITYESTVICSPELPAEKIDELVEKIRKIVEDTKGQILITQQLGKKRLAYPIKKYREGSYVYFELSGTGESISALENFFKVNDTIIRSLTVKAGKKKPAKPAAIAAEEPKQQIPQDAAQAPQEVTTDDTDKSPVA